MNVAQASSAARAAGATVVGFDDDNYPPLLREIRDPPRLLYARGNSDLLREAQLAVVGSRRASAAAIRVAESLSGDLAQAGLHISSGLARGVDGAAHRGALAASGRTIAVMATGIERVYPSRHRGLAEEIARSGCLVTELPPGTPLRRHNFPVRNRIISGMSLGVLVVEAALPSGSLITAGTALEQGREVFALPWSPLHGGGSGCLQLIRDGAKMVQGAEDILEELGPLYRTMRSAAGISPPGPQPDSWLLDLVGFEVVALDALVERSARPVAQVMAELSALEIAGVVERASGGYIRR
jgi:DNA processing protein